MPIVVLRGFHHGALRTPNTSRIRDPKGLVGANVGVRAYSQTTGVWVRGILQQEYGIGADQMQWLTTEDAHVPGFVDPIYVTRAESGVKLQSLLTDGLIAAAIGDGSSSFPDSRSVIADPEQAAKHWYERTGVHPVNHVIAFRREFLDREPWISGELYRLFQDSRELWLANPSVPAADDLPYGREAHENAIILGLSSPSFSSLLESSFTMKTCSGRVSKLDS